MAEGAARSLPCTGTASTTTACPISPARTKGQAHTGEIARPSASGGARLLATSARRHLWCDDGYGLAVGKEYALFDCEGQVVVSARADKAQEKNRLLDQVGSGAGYGVDVYGLGGIKRVGNSILDRGRPVLLMHENAERSGGNGSANSQNGQLLKSECLPFR